MTATYISLLIDKERFDVLRKKKKKALINVEITLLSPPTKKNNTNPPMFFLKKKISRKQNKRKKERRKKANPIFSLGAKVEISLFLVKTYNVFQHETSDEWSVERVKVPKAS